MHKTLPLCALALAAATFLSMQRGAREVRAGTAVKLDVVGLVDKAELAFEGRVLARRSYTDERGRIETEYTVRVDETFRGEARALRTFHWPGGVLADGRGLLIPGMPQLAVGEDLVLFLSREGSTGARMPVGLGQGKYTVLRDASGKKRVTRALGELSLVDPVSGALHAAPAEGALDYDALVAEIRGAVATLGARRGGR